MARDYPFQRLSIIFPCFNEAENLSRFETDVFAYFDAQELPYEWILVDDGSTDTTWSAAEALTRRHPAGRLVRHDRNQGLGAAIRSGLAAASGDAILTMDADLTFSPSDAMRLLSAYGPGVDCVSGSPVKGTFRHIPFVRRFLSYAVNRLYSLVLGQPVTATSSIFRVYRAGRVKNIPLTCSNFDINAELLFSLIRTGARIQEVAVDLTARRLGLSKINTAREIRNHLRMFGRILKWRCSGN